MGAVRPLHVAPAASATDADASARMPALGVEGIYERHFDFVWRNARRMGVREEDLDDAVQDVFVVVHRRIAEFEQRSSVETWLFSILLRVVQHYRRSKARRLARLTALLHFTSGDAEPEPREGALELLTRHEQAALLHRLLGDIDDGKRAVFILIELEQRSAPEVAEALGMNVNTVYSRVRAARQELERAVARLTASERGLARP
jgi:RNA polymerase sigma-70 factor (ECF subfamily)